MVILIQEIMENVFQSVYCGALGGLLPGLEHSVTSCVLEAIGQIALHENCSTIFID